MFKNVASQKIQLFAFDTTTGAAKTGDSANITAYLSKDHGSFTVLGDTSATEMDSTNGKGIYLFDLTQSETNANELTFKAGSTTANVSVTPRFVTTVPANFTALVIDSSGLADANAVKVGPSGSGTAQTARDIGASVLLSAGTGTGQLDFTSGVVKSNLAQILGTALTETAGQIAAGFKKFFNIATPAATMDHLVLVDTVTTATTATNLTNAPTNGDLTAAMKASVNAEADTAIADASLPSAATIADAVWDELLSGHAISGSAGAGLSAAGSAGDPWSTALPGAYSAGEAGYIVGAMASDAADTLAYATRTVIRGTVASGGSTTTFTASALSPSGVDADQFKGRIIIFDNDTTTAALRGEATDITANTGASLPAFTYSALTTAPQAGDTFSVV